MITYSRSELTPPTDAAAGPIVSVIVRSMARPSLRDALHSIAVQDYPNIEIMLVNAKGAGHESLEDHWGHLELRVIDLGYPLSRSQAANVGLKHARGDYLIFLDDDDVFYSEHITNLVRALIASNTYRCAYAGVRIEYRNEFGLLHDAIINRHYDVVALRGRNFIPIHAVLFERSLIDEGCRFDESIDILEDWDFWLNVSQHTDFLHVDRVTACYRNYGNSGLGNRIDHTLLRSATARVYEKWRTVWTGQQWADTVLLLQEPSPAHLQHQEPSPAPLQHMVGEDTAKLVISTGEMTSSLSDYINKHCEVVIHHLHDLLRLSQCKVAPLAAALESGAAEQAAMLAEIDMLRDLQTQAEITEKTLAESLAEASERIGALLMLVEQSDRKLNLVFHSTSWRVTAPLRVVVLLARRKYREAWETIKQSSYSYTVDQVENKLHVEQKTDPQESDPLTLVATQVSATSPASSDPTTAMAAQTHLEIPALAWRGDLLNVNDLPPWGSDSPGRIAIHAHVYYDDLAVELANHISQVPYPFDLYVSTSSQSASLICDQNFAGLPNLNKLTIVQVPNRGRDIAPLLCRFRDAMKEYDFIAHIHTKKSLYNAGATDGWRQYLLENLFGSQERVRRILSLLRMEQGVGLVFPQTFVKLPYMANTWLSNQGLGRELCKRFDVSEIPKGYFSFPAGSMFWARVEAMRPLLDYPWQFDEFPEESGQTDGTLAHCIERMLAVIVQKTGYKPAILSDETFPSWTPWRLDQYLAGTHEQIEDMIASPNTRLVIFDIFDTLVLRPLVDPESVKLLVARQVGSEFGDTYLALRGRAEEAARQVAGRDVGLGAVYEQIMSLSGLPAGLVQDWRKIEERIELLAVRRRPETAALLESAAMQGKRVVLASDMYLPREVIEAILERNAIRGWERLYLSSEIGVRKDHGDMYKYILEQENVLPCEALVIGDNEHSDLQIPWDRGFQCRHVLRPVELARAMPRLGPLVDRVVQDRDIHADLTMGLIIRANLHPITFRRFDPLAFTLPTPWSIGFTVLGPVVMAFVQWLAERAASEGVQRLYFLSREGQFLKAVYDRCMAQSEVAPDSRYLVVSRRAVTVPNIETLEDIFAIARTPYFRNTTSRFLKERYGLDVARGNIFGTWQWDTPLEIFDGNIEPIVELLDQLQVQIYEGAAAEKVGLQAYLNSAGLYNEVSSAVVDVGYSGTIQDRLNRLVGRKIHGFYMATSYNARTVSARHGVIADGCYAHLSGPDSPACAIYDDSFDLEKLLSSDDAQVVRYHMRPDGEVETELCDLSNAELGARATRDMVRRGAMAFVEEALTTQKELFADFVVPTSLARDLYAAFSSQPSGVERDILGRLVLDDHYCGRGLVS